MEIGGWRSSDFVEIGCICERGWLLRSGQMLCEARVVAVCFSERAEGELAPREVEAVLLVPGSVALGTLLKRFSTGGFGMDGDAVQIDVSLVKGPASQWLENLVDSCMAHEQPVAFDGGAATHHPDLGLVSAELQDVDFTECPLVLRAAPDMAGFCMQLWSRAVRLSNTSFFPAWKSWREQRIRSRTRWETSWKRTARPRGWLEYPMG